MPIEFTHLHNLVRTYQRSLHLNEPEKLALRSTFERNDRVLISDEAREEQRHLEVHPGKDTIPKSGGSTPASA